MTEFMGLAEKVSKFNQEALKHIERQTLNPFSGRFSRSPSPRPKFNKDEYGKPAAGSKTEMRGQKAFTQISREILELCECIHDMGARRRDSDGDECIIIPFGELFAFYTKISDKVVGLLIAAKKRGFVYFEPEILFQRRDDDVLIALLKPIGEIRNVINRQISASPSPAPPQASSSDSGRASPSTTPSPLARQDSNPSFDTSSTANEATKTSTESSSIEESTTPSVESPSSPVTENPPTQTLLHPLEEEPAAYSEVPIVETKEETTASPEESSEVKPEDLSAATESDPSSSTDIQPSGEDKEGITSEETSSKPEEKVETEEITSIPSETKEIKRITEADSEDQECLTIKIVVEVEPDQEVKGVEMSESGHASQDLSATEETSATLQEATTNTEPADSSSTNTIKTEQQLDCKASVLPAAEEELPPSSDTGEKTMA